MRFCILVIFLFTSTAFAKDPIQASSYFLCAASHYDNIGITSERLLRELSRAEAASASLPYLEFWSEGKSEMYRIRKPVREPELSRRQVGQQHYWLCLRVSEQ